MQNQGYYNQRGYNGGCNNGYQSPPPPYQYSGTLPANWKNWMTWAVTGTIIGAILGLIGAVLGIVAIIKSNEANDAARRGDPRALEINSSAKIWTYITWGYNIFLIVSGIITTLVVILIYLGIFGMIFGAAAAANG